MVKRKVYVVDGARTPFLKARGKRGPFAAADLAVQAGRALLMRMPFSPTEFDEVILGCVMPEPHEANIARIVALRLGCGKSVPAWTVQRNCASGMQAIDAARLKIMSGESELILVGGTEAMSRAPLLFQPDLVNWLADLNAAKTLPEKLKRFIRLRPGFLAPVISILKGLTDPVVGLNMGQTAENLAFKFGISREQMDEFSVQSHLKVHQAMANEEMDEIVTLVSDAGLIYAADDGVRPDSSLEKLAKLSAFFDRVYGMVTAGNSSQITDGAAMLVLASAAAVRKYKLPILGTVDDVQWAALEPEFMGLGPAYAIPPLLSRNHMVCEDVDAWEINEAFAAQVIANVLALQDAKFCKDALGLDAPFGEIRDSQLNREGGAIAMGHPIGASGARIVLHVLKAMQRRGEKVGVASICIGGGQGGAVLVSGGGQ